MAAGDEVGVGGEVGSPWPFLPSRSPGPRELACRSPGPAGGRDGGDQAPTLPRSLAAESARPRPGFTPAEGGGWNWAADLSLAPPLWLGISI